MSERFAGRVALVTGGSSGIGFAVAERLLREGAKVATLDLAESGPAGGLALTGDVRRSEEIDAAVRRAEAELGPIDLVVLLARDHGACQPINSNGRGAAGARYRRGARLLRARRRGNGRVRLQHVSVAIAADGADAARVFYGDQLGLEERPVPPKLDPRELVWFSAAGDLELHLMQTGDEPPPHAHFCLAVDAGLDELRARLEAAGIETRTPTEIVGRPRFMCRDPFGNVVELTELPR